MLGPTLREWQSTLTKRLTAVRDNYEKLTNKESQYAKEHLLLIQMYTEMLEAVQCRM